MPAKPKLTPFQTMWLRILLRNDKAHLPPRTKAAFECAQLVEPTVTGRYQLTAKGRRRARRVITDNGALTK